MRGQGVAGEEDVEKPMRISSQMCSTLPVWTTAGPSTARIFSPAALVRRMAAAISRTVTPLGFSLDTGLAMNSNRLCRAAVSRGEDAQALPADDDRDRPCARRVIGRQRAVVSSDVDQDAAIHLLILDLDPVAAEADLRAVVGGAVEALGKGPVHVGRLDRRSRRPMTGTAPWSWMASRMSSQDLRRVGAWTSMRAKLGSVCFWPMRMSLMT